MGKNNTITCSSCGKRQRKGDAHNKKTCGSFKKVAVRRKETANSTKTARSLSHTKKKNDSWGHLFLKENDKVSGAEKDVVFKYLSVLIHITPSGHISAELFKRLCVTQLRYDTDLVVYNRLLQSKNVPTPTKRVLAKSRWLNEELKKSGTIENAVTEQFIQNELQCGVSQ